MRVPVLSAGFQKTVRLDGRAVYLRQPRWSDWRAWSRLREASCGFLVPWEPTWPHDALSAGAFRRRLRINSQEWRDGHGYSFLIFSKRNDEILGGITLSNLRRGVAQCASLGYWIGEPHARHGHMSDALQALLGFSFGELALHRVEAACLPWNEASRGLLLKNGFREEGQAKSYLRINGQWQDHVLYALLCEEWRMAGKQKKMAKVEA